MPSLFLLAYAAGPSLAWLRGQPPQRAARRFAFAQLSSHSQGHSSSAQGPPKPFPLAYFGPAGGGGNRLAVPQARREKTLTETRGDFYTRIARRIVAVLEQDFPLAYER